MNENLPSLVIFTVKKQFCITFELNTRRERESEREKLNASLRLLILQLTGSL